LAVHLTRSTDHPVVPCRYRCEIGPGAHIDDGSPPGLAAQLENAFDAIRLEWAAIAKKLSAEPSSTLAHMPACAANASDFGLMLAWSRVIADWVEEETVIHLICDDPWVFRHLAELSGVRAGPPPTLWRTALSLSLRGYAARFKAAANHLIARLTLPRGGASENADGVALLVYGHPASTAVGRDAYFGDLIDRLPNLTRILHVDCPRTGAMALSSPKTSSLHAWGPLTRLFALPFQKWRPSRRQLSGPHGWLIRRAAAIEGGTGQAAMIAWQIACQQSWLNTAGVRTVAWPWENHAWERVFIRAANAVSVKTVGYQHTIVGDREWNYAPDSNLDGADSLPDVILVSGPAGENMLVDYGIPAERIETGGTLRRTSVTPLPHDPDGPVFVALPFDGDIAAQMIAAIRPLGALGRRFIVKTHPMTPFDFSPSAGIEETEVPLDQQASMAGVLYAATTVGLEAVLGGLPTLRFRPVGKVPTDVVPKSIPVPTVDAAGLKDALAEIATPPAIAAENIFAEPDYPLWQSILAPDIDTKDD
jgi:hypothetical protein